ncbi:MAG: glycosyltransferase family 2 protein [Fimbriimonadaceae bacterium]|nr:glycosyltransferase family 2 protein [Fimbriimonadaceae bacterium]QYK58205.1 MAG: glycosyltransferase family 2 protein [Fimbriimonadaceae bacterium]
MPTVSVIVPSYNHGRFLDQALESVAAQTFSDWEVVVVDDQSHDDSLERAEKWAARDPRFRVFSNQENLGTYGTQQRAVELARGSLIAVLNSDDLWRPDKLRLQVEALEFATKARYCYTLGWMCDEDGREDTEVDVHGAWSKEPIQDPLPWLVDENRILASSVLWRREILHFHTDLRYSGDWVALIKAGSPAVLVPERLTLWRIHGSNSFTLRPEQAMEEVRVRIALRESLCGQAELGEGLAMNDANLIALFLLFGERRLALQLVPSILKSPLKRKFALRRALSVLLPIQMSRPHLWPGVDPAPYEKVRARLRTLPGLAIRPFR